MDRSFEAADKQAFHAANVNSTCGFEFVTETRSYATAPVVHGRVVGVADPASLQVDKLIESLRRYGDLEHLRLVLADEGESVRLELLLRVDETPHQVVCDVKAAR
jgi:hypothetical protein